MNNKIKEYLDKLSDKELRKELDAKNFYNAKYFVYKGDENNFIFELKTRLDNNFIIQDDGYQRIIPHGEFVDYFEYLTYEKYKTKFSSINTILKKVKHSSIFKIVLNVLIEHHGEDKVDSKGESYITIHYPEILITNSAELSHIMRDVYLELYIDENRLYINRLYRATRTEAEIKTNYLFSHSNNSDRIRGISTSFCYGSDNPINTFLNSSMRRLNKLEGFKSIKMLPFILDEYLSWESVEGVPWYHLERVVNYSSEDNHADIPSEYNVEEVIKLLYNSIETFDYDYVLNRNDNYEIKLTSESKLMIKGKLYEICPESFRFAESSGGHSITGESNFNKSYYEDVEVLKFKGETVLSKVYDEQEDVNVRPKHIHSSILSDIITLIESEYSEFLTNKEIESCQQQQQQSNPQNAILGL